MDSHSEQERYKLVQKLGAGAMGEVWLAKDALLDRPVAVKYLSAADNDTHRELFLSEAKLLASLNHPHITLIYDALFDEAQNQYYLVMEYVEGVSLATLIEESNAPLPLETILDTAITLLEALDYAHGQGIVHRDIKPENVMIQGDQVKLTDFGLASLVSLLSDGVNHMVGTPTYISPEQILGLPTDGRSDLYALGIMMYVLITGGEEPFADCLHLSELLDAHLKTPPPSLQAHSNQIPIALDHLIQQLLAKQPEDRPPSARDVIAQLEVIQARQSFQQADVDFVEGDKVPFVGREHLLQQLDDVWKRAQRTLKTHLAVVQGDVGVGKSRLVTTFLGKNVIDKGRVALVGRCDEAGTPYAPFATMVATIVEKGLLKSPLSHHQLEHLLGQMPSLARTLSIIQPAEGASLAPDPLDQSLVSQWQFFTTILAMLSQLGPTTLFLEDAQFLDEVSLGLIKYLVSQDQLPMLIIATCQKGTKNHPLWSDTFTPEPALNLHLAPLLEGESKDMIQHLLQGGVTESVFNVVAKQSQGNPLQIEDTVRSLVETGAVHQDDDGQWHYTRPKDMDDALDNLLPETALNAFARRLKRLSEGTREVLQYAALIEPGPEFDFDVWVEILGGEETQIRVQMALNEALEKRLLRRIGENRYVFRQANLAAALIEAIPKDKQREAHQKIAQVVERKQGALAVVGYHYEQAGMPENAATFLSKAGQRAVESHAVNTAIQYYNRANTLVETDTANLALGNLYRQQGRWSEAQAAYQRALNLMDQAHLAGQGRDLALEAQILNNLAFTLWLADRYNEAAQYASKVLKLAVPESEKAIAQSHLGMIMWLMGRLADGETWCQKAVRTLQEHEEQGVTSAHLASAYNRLALIYLAQGNLAGARLAAQQALSRRKTLADFWGQGYSSIVMGNIATEQGDFQQATTWFDVAQKLFSKVNSQDGLMVVFAHRGRSLLHQDRPEDALPLLTQALHLAFEIEKYSAYGLGEIYLLIGQACLARGDLGRAEAAVQDALKLVERAGNQQYIALGRSLLAQIHAQRGDHFAANTSFEESIRLFETVGDQPNLLRTKAHFARFLSLQNQTQKAIQLSQDVETAAARIGLYLNYGGVLEKENLV
ncbi:MAG: protein kinase [Chloroflexota bacterium]